MRFIGKTYEEELESVEVNGFDGTFTCWGVWYVEYDQDGDVDSENLDNWGWEYYGEDGEKVDGFQISKEVESQLKKAVIDHGYLGDCYEWQDLREMRREMALDMMMKP